jgi:hypothetical protein
VSFLKEAWKQIQLAWEKDDTSQLSSGTNSNETWPVTVAKKLTKSAIQKSKTANGLSIISNIEIVALHILYMLNEEVNLLLKSPHKPVPLTLH